MEDSIFEKILKIHPDISKMHPLVLKPVKKHLEREAENIDKQSEELYMFGAAFSIKLLMQFIDDLIRSDLERNGKAVLNYDSELIELTDFISKSSKDL